MVFRVLFLFEIHIQQRLYLTGGTLPRVLLEERKLNISKQKNIMAAQKCKIIQ